MIGDLANVGSPAVTCCLQNPYKRNYRASKKTYTSCEKTKIDIYYYLEEFP